MPTTLSSVLTAICAKAGILIDFPPGEFARLGEQFDSVTVPDDVFTKAVNNIRTEEEIQSDPRWFNYFTAKFREDLDQNFSKTVAKSGLDVKEIEHINSGASMSEKVSRFGEILSKASGNQNIVQLNSKIDELLNKGKDTVTGEANRKAIAELEADALRFGQNNYDNELLEHQNALSNTVYESTKRQQ